MPKVYRGVPQFPLSGVSMRYTFDAQARRPDDRRSASTTPCSAPGAIWENGWMAAAVHAPITGKGHFDQDEWQLYHVDEDRSESKDLAKQYPDKLKALIDAWNEEADKNLVLPLDDRTGRRACSTSPRPTEEPPRERYVYYPGTSPVPESVAVNVRGRSYKILADVEITDPNASGVIFAHGSRFGGHALFIKDQQAPLRLQLPRHQAGAEASSPSELKPGKYTVGMEFIREKTGPHHESLGKTKLYVDDKVVAEGPMRTQAGKFTLSGDGLCVGYDSGDAVSQEYKAPGNVQGREHPLRRGHRREDAVPRPRGGGGAGVQPGLKEKPIYPR